MEPLILEPGRINRLYWSDLWRYRELFYVLAWRDFSVRYKQTAIGVLWAFIQTFIQSIVFTYIFGRMAHFSTAQKAPYFLIVFAATIPWQFFSNSLTQSSQSLIGTNANLISKVYFPRLIVPISTIVTYLADVVVSFILLIGVIAWFHYLPNWRMIFLPVFIAIAFAAALGPGLFLAALTVQYRDFRYVVPFIVQVGAFISPVGYPTSQYGDLRLLYSLNPMVAPIDGFRWAILGADAPLYWPGFALSLAVSIVLLVIGLTYFRRMERSFADVI